MIASMETLELARKIQAWIDSQTDSGRQVRVMLDKGGLQSPNQYSENKWERTMPEFHRVYWSAWKKGDGEFSQAIDMHGKEFRHT